MAGLIPQHFIDELITRTDVVEVIGGRVQLKKAGREYKACCPFHDEKTPSFTVSPGKQFYHCFGCGAHGTALTFLMEYDHMGFVEAIEDLAGRVGLEIPREEGQTGDRGEHQALYEMMGQVDGFYRRSLKQDVAAVEYLKSRGLTGKVALEFGIGYVADAWDTLLRKFGDDETSLRRLKKLGLVIERDDGSGHYDRFRGRVMFPIRDGRGRTIGFGGRIIGDGEPKYLNSPETPLFHKGRELYGLFEARKALRDIPRLLVVEGYMDVVGLAQHDIHYAVATLGTATTGDHFNRLFRVTDEVVFCFDGDRAGRVAAWRALENALPNIRDSRQIRFMFLPDGEDPDSLVRKEGAEKFEARLSEASTLSEFMVARLSEDVDLGSLDGRAKLAETARPLINKIPQGVFRRLLVEHLAQIVRLSPDMLDRLIPTSDGGGLVRTQPARPARRRRRQQSTGRGNLVRQAVSLVLHYPRAAAETGISDELRALDRPGVSLLIALLEETARSPNISTAGLVERRRDEPEWPHLMNLAAAEILVSEEAAAAELNDAIRRLIHQEGPESRADALLAKAGDGELSETEKRELQSLLAKRGAVQTENDSG